MSEKLTSMKQMQFEIDFQNDQESAKIRKAKVADLARESRKVLGGPTIAFRLLWDILVEHQNAEHLLLHILSQVPSHVGV